MSGSLDVIVPPALAGERLDRALAQLAAEAGSDLSRTRLQALVRDGAVTVAGAVVADPKHRVREGDALCVSVPDALPAEPAGEAIALVIVHEDEDVIVIDKPAGLVVHPAAGHETGTLVNALVAHCGDTLSGIGGVRRPGIVHRLDKDTSGLLVVAKNDRAHQGLSAQFADHGRTGPLERAYEAIVWGVPDRVRGTIEAPIDRDSRSRERMAVVRAGHGREAVTHWERLEAFADADGKPLAARLLCQLETGRTHQIRVHLTHAGHPLLGDPLYGTGFRTKSARLPPGTRAVVDAFPRQALHARTLGFAHPRTGETLRFESPLPPDMAALLAALRG